MLRKWKTGLRCPSCNYRFAPSELIFPDRFLCPKCDTVLRVSLLYLRVLMVVSFMIAFPLVWIAGVQNIEFGCPAFTMLVWALLGFPSAFLLWLIAMCVAPFLIPPTLVTHHPTYITTLGLANVEGNRHHEN
jgi:hypothetical protein